MIEICWFRRVRPPEIRLLQFVRLSVCSLLVLLLGSVNNFFRFVLISEKQRCCIFVKKKTWSRADFGRWYASTYVVSFIRKLYNYVVSNFWVHHESFTEILNLISPKKLNLDLISLHRR